MIITAPEESLPNIRFHDLRHTFATQAIAGGVDPKSLSHLLGHTKASFSLDRYTHVTTEMQAGAAKKIDRAITGVEAVEEDVAAADEVQSEEEPAFVPAEGKYRKRGTGYVKQLSENCWQGAVHADCERQEREL